MIITENVKWFWMKTINEQFPRHDSRLIKTETFIYFTHFWQLYNFHIFIFF
jgi:hypothetical protein